MVVKDGGGLFVANGTQVMLTSTLGTIAPSTAVTEGGTVKAIFKAPPTGSGTAAITITSASTTASASVVVDCQAPEVLPTPMVSPVMMPTMPTFARRTRVRRVS